MRKFSLQKLGSNELTVVLLNGGGQQPYNKFHKLARFFSRYNCNIISVELPGHGQTPFSAPPTASSMLEEFYENFRETLSAYPKVALVGFSLGALLSLKALENNVRVFEFVISIGAGLKISIHEEKVMQQYASIEFFKKMGWEKHMLEYHKEGWKELIASLPDMLRVGSELFVSDDFTSDTPLHLVIGDNDGVIDHSLQNEFVQQPKIHLHVVPSTAHFAYFSTSWKKTEKILEEIADQYLRRKNS